MAIASWYCTHPCERVFDPADGDPLPEPDRCCHEECKPTSPQSVLDATPLDEQDFAELRDENDRLRDECNWLAGKLTERRGETKLELEDIRRLDIKPGQYLVATLPQGVTPRDTERVRAALKDGLPDGVNVLVVVGVDLMVLNPQDLTDALLGVPPR